MVPRGVGDHRLPRWCSPVLDYLMGFGMTQLCAAMSDFQDGANLYHETTGMEVEHMLGLSFPSVIGIAVSGVAWCSTVKSFRQTITS